MKKITTLFLMLLFTSASLLAQYRYDKLPVCVDAEWTIKDKSEYRINRFLPAEVVKPEHFKPKNAKPVIQTESGIELINVSNSWLGQSEAWISVNPFNSNQLIVGSNDSKYNQPDYDYRMSSWYSNDAGRTWTHSNLPPGLCDDCPITVPSNGGNTMVDPGLAFDSHGDMYYVYLFTQLFNDDSPGENGVFVSKSEDGGKTWLRDWDQENTDEDLVTFYYDILQDKCFMAADPNPESPYADRLYVSWYNTGEGGKIDIAYYDREEGWWESRHLPGAANGVQSPLPVVGPEGVVYVVWEQKESSSQVTKCMIHKSEDGGATWDYNFPKTVQTVRTSGEQVGYRKAFPDKDNMRTSSHPFAAVDMNNGNIYIVQAGKDSENQYGVFFSKSTDGGETWTTEDGRITKIRAIDNGELRNDRFMPSIAVDQSTGMIAVGYYSSQNVQANDGCDFYVAVSMDEGETWSHVRVTDESIMFVDGSTQYAGSENLGQYWGDYTCIAAADGQIWPIFWMPTDASLQYRTCDLFTALLSTEPMTPAGLSLENDSQDPTKINLSWTDPIGNKLGQDIADLGINIYVDNELVGTVDGGVESYVFSGAENGHNYYIEIAAVDNAIDKESKRVGNYITAGGLLTPEMPTDVSATSLDNGFKLTWTNPAEHIDGTAASDLYAINVYANRDYETPLLEITDGVEAGAVMSIDVTNCDNNNYYGISIKAITKRGEIFDESTLTDEIFAYAGPATTELSLDFESTDFPFYTNTTWAVTDLASVSGSHCITDSPDGDYSSETKSFVLFAPVVISEGKTTLSFNYIACIDKKVDYGELYVSSDGGQTWDGIISFDENTSEKFGNELSESDWEELHMDLSSYLGETVICKFSIFSNKGVEDDGLFIDDVVLGDHEISVEKIENMSSQIDVNIVPNPVVETAKIDMKLLSAGQLTVEIFDALGNIVLTMDEGYVNAGPRTLNLDMSQFSTGAYYCHIEYSGNHATVPFVVK